MCGFRHQRNILEPSRCLHLMAGKQVAGDHDLAEKYLGYAWSFFQEAYSATGPNGFAEGERHLVAAIALLRTSHEVHAGGGAELKDNHDEPFVRFVRQLRNLHIHQGDIIRVDATHARLREASEEEEEEATHGASLVLEGLFDFALDPHDLDGLELRARQRQALKEFLEPHRYRVGSALLAAFQKTAAWFGVEPWDRGVALP